MQNQTNEKTNSETTGHGGAGGNFNGSPVSGGRPFMPNTPISGVKVHRFNSKKFLLGVGLGVVIILVLSAVVFGVGIYRLGWSGGAVYKITKVVPYPAAFVNWQPIDFFDYQDDIITLNNFFARQAEELGTAEDIPSDAELKESVIDRLIKNEVAEQLAVKYDVGVSEEDLESEMQVIIDQEESREAVEEILKSQYGWGIEQFKIKVLHPFLLQQKLQEAINNDEALNQEVKNKAEEILSKVKSGEKSFEELAQEFGEDGTAPEGGDLGYFGRGTMVPEFEEAVFALEKGEIGNLVKTEYGYHIVKVEDQITDEAGEVTQVRARHILIRIKNIDEFLDEEIGKAKIWRLIKI